MRKYFHPFLDRPLEYLKGVGPAKAVLLQKERGLFCYGDLLYDFPFRYEDRTRFTAISSIQNTDLPVQLRGKLGALTTLGQGRKQRLISYLEDETGRLELVWFRGVKYLLQNLKPGQVYIAYGRLNSFKGKFNMPHPEMEVFNAEKVARASHFAPVYASTEKLNGKGLDHRTRRRMIKQVLAEMKTVTLQESLSQSLISKLKLCTRAQALSWIHLPQKEEQLHAAQARLKFEELFYIQLIMVRRNIRHKKRIKGHVFERIGQHFNHFYENILPFELTSAQKRVLKEIRADMKSGAQMNRLLQRDVGSGKTIVALMSALMALDNGYQCCIMAPTEILAQQHYQSISEQLAQTDIQVGFLSGSVKGAERKEVLRKTAEGSIHILIGTHALIEPTVQYKNLGLAITDEQHRFGVKQRAELWKKNNERPPHILVMTATPIPRTLAMTLYGDLDVSVIDELPPGRKEIQTTHVYDSKRMEVYNFIRKQIHQGRQIYIVYPLIEESKKLELRDLTNGFERLLHYFPRPTYQMSMVHGQMKPDEKEAEMQKFVERKTQIMVATTVIEVGVNVPNASVMLIENAERFGLSQLHQLRGRVGRGAEQSFCLLMTDFKLSKEAKKRIHTMCSTNDGFKIAEADLELRGPGEIAGTRQSGDLGLKIASLSEDQGLIKTARNAAKMILREDEDLSSSENKPIADYLNTQGKFMQIWTFIS
jgi:ATP-dependent DNA helicase RecG